MTANPLKTKALRSAAFTILLLGLCFPLAVGQSAPATDSTTRHNPEHLTMWDITPYVLVDASIDEAKESRIDANPPAAAVNPTPSDVSPGSTEPDESQRPPVNWSAAKAKSLPVTSRGPQRKPGNLRDEPPASLDSEQPGVLAESSPAYRFPLPAPETPPSPELTSQPLIPAGQNIDHHSRNERHKLAQQRSLRRDCAARHLSPPECRLLRYELGSTGHGISLQSVGQPSRP